MQYAEALAELDKLEMNLLKLELPLKTVVVRHSDYKTTTFL